MIEFIIGQKMFPAAKNQGSQRGTCQKYIQVASVTLHIGYGYDLMNGNGLSAIHREIVFGKPIL